jgi:hypothetical protein
MLEQRDIVLALMERDVSINGPFLRLFLHLMHGESGFTALVTTLRRTSLADR